MLLEVMLDWKSCVTMYNRLMYIKAERRGRGALVERLIASPVMHVFRVRALLVRSIKN